MPRKRSEDLFEDTKMTFGEHLEELRGALFRSCIGLVIGFLVGLAVSKHVVRGITVPLKSALRQHYEKLAEERLSKAFPDGVSPELQSFMVRERLLYDEVYLEQAELQRIAGDAPNDFAGISLESDVTKAPLPFPGKRMVKTRIWRMPNTDVQSLSAQEPFMIWMKAGFFTGVIVASPYIFWQIWSFVAAGLYPHEKRYVYMFLPISLVLFWAGAALAFFVVFRFVLEFLFQFNRSLDIQTDPRISEWIGFVLFMPLGFGVAFQLPVVMFFLNRIGIFSLQAYLAQWRIAVLVIFVISMLLTPSADPISMLLMALPLTVLYFLGVAMSKWMPRSRSSFRDAYDP